MNTHKLLQNQLTEEFFKKSIFCGDVIIIKKSNEILNIVNVIEKYFTEIFDDKIISLKSGKLKYNKEINKLFIIFQNKIKYSKYIKYQFSLFLDKIDLLPSKTFIDMITLRFSPRKGRRPIGNLTPSRAHRDTWASNIFNQINDVEMPKYEEYFVTPQDVSLEKLINSHNISYKKLNNLDNLPSELNDLEKYRFRVLEINTDRNNDKLTYKGILNGKD